MNKKYYIVIFAIALLGLILSFIITPTNREVALMNMEDKHYESAFFEYSRMYGNGNKGVDVIFPLVKLYVQYGDLDGAIAIMEEFQRNNPDSVDAAEQLSTLYKSSQRIYEYTQNLEKIRNKRPTIDTYRELADIYGLSGNYLKQQEILQEMIANEAESESITDRDYMNLAYLYATQKKYGDAVSVLNRLILRKDNEIDIEAAGFAVSVMLDASQNEKAHKTAKNYIKKNKNPQNLKFLSTLMHHKNRPELALNLIEQFHDLIENDSELFSEYALLNLIMGKQKEMFSYLSERLKNNKLPDEMLSYLIELAIYFKDFQIISDIVSSEKFYSLPVGPLLYVIETTILQDQPDLAAKIVASAPSKYFEDRPLLAMILEFASTKNKSGTRALVDAIEKKARSLNLTDDYKSTILSIYRKSGHKDKAIALIKTVPIINALRVADTDDVVKTWIELGKSDEALKKIDAEMKQKEEVPDQASLQRARILLASGGGNKDYIYNILKDDKIDANLLEDAHYIATSYNHLTIAIDIARAIYSRESTPKNRIILAESLIRNRQYEEAISHLRDLISSEKDAYQPYLAALAGLVREKGPDKMEEYNESINTLLASMLSIPDVKLEEIFQLAHYLKAVGLSDQAKVVFFELAKNEPPESHYVEEFFNFIGKNPEPKHIEWLVERINKADTPSDKAKWLLFLNNFDKTDMAIKIIESYRGELGPELADAYIQLLITSRNKEKLGKILNKELAKEQEPGRKVKIALTAFQENLASFDDNDEFFETIKSSAKEPMVAKQFATIAFRMGKYDISREYFEIYLNESEGDYQSNYLYGEILWRDKEYNKAEKNYAIAEKHLESLMIKDLDARVTEAGLLFRRKKIDRSVELFRQLLKENPDDKGLRAGFANILIEIGNYDEAASVLSEAQNN